LQLLRKSQQAFLARPGIVLLATGLFGLFGTRARHMARRLRLLPEAVNMVIL
jgi:hypothetical protein